MIRIGLTQRVEVIADRGERRDCLDQAWTRLLTRNGMIPIPLCNAVEDIGGYVAALALDGIILTGGNDLEGQPGATNVAPERDALERALLALSRDRDVPLLGVCRGMQMAVVEDGGSLAPKDGHVAAPHGIAMSGAKCDALPLTDRDMVNSFHGFAVTTDGLGPGWEAVATAPDGTVEAMVRRDARQWAVMWHPERAPYDERDALLLRELFGKAGR